MNIRFEKYQGAGNDFLILEKDEVERAITPSANIADLVRAISRPHYGIAADGVFVICGYENSHWRLSFYNCDGSQASMCGNGARCVSAYLFSRLSKQTELTLAIGDLRIASKRLPDGQISLHMPVDDTLEWLPAQGGYLINTGVPHLVMQCDTIEELQALDLTKVARPLRYEVCGTTGGVNVDYYCKHGDKILMRTYERGVEGETRACGTGAVAVALVAASVYNLPSPQIIQVVGGKLSVAFQIRITGNEEFRFQNIYLTGDAVRVAKGEYFY